MNIKELLFLILCFSIQLINIAADGSDSYSVTEVLKNMPTASNPNLVDSVLWICTAQQLSSILIDFTNTQPSGEEYVMTEKLVTKLWRTLDGEIHQEEFSRYLSVFQDIKNKKSISNSELSSFVTYIVGNSPAGTIMSCIFGKYSEKPEPLQNEVLSYKNECPKIINMFTTDNLVEWMWNKLNEIKEDISYENSILRLTQYRMISNVISPSTINEKTKIKDDDQTDDTETELGEILVSYGCDLFSQYLKDILRIYNDFASAVEEVKISDMNEKEDNINFIKGVLQEFTDIMVLVKSYSSLPSDCLKDVTLNQATGEIWRINEKIKTIFVNFIKDIGGLDPESLEQDKIIKGNSILKYILNGKKGVNPDKLDKTYKPDDRTINYDTYYINDQKFINQDSGQCAHHYPIKFTDKIKKIISLRSVITFYSTSLLKSKYKTIPIAVQLDDKNILKNVVPEYV